MPRLCHFISTESILKLNQNNVFTVNEFLQIDSDTLSVYASLPVEDIISVKQQLLEAYSGDVKSGFDLLHFEDRGLCKTGIEELDSLTKGGLRPGSILELSGLSGSGKTQLALNILVNLSLKDDIDAVYIDTKNDFRPEHFSSLLKAKLKEDEKLEGIIKKIFLQKIMDIHELISALHNLKIKYSESKRNSIRLIIVDSISVVSFPFLGNNEGLPLLNHIACVAKFLAAEFNAIIIFINLAIRHFNDKEATEELRPFLGKYWLYVPNTRLMISRPDPSHISRKIQVAKSDTLKNGDFCMIDILENGLIV
ncbi:DNA repair protein RAD51 homolog 4 [Cimex lectularius]|uniref:RecA family profile 1 domain-containing protein n=1 Tax=Cimex lectularius TaxID=79782 RepID=A0A8I6RJW1_CIMLE|nr:DNA repair protein RAD51 homolog 4 [Cimex lectularius]XP_014246397.1 DNA repair protein RAD51 homolog 4 [Cimex lectularius]XP_024081564.1 DNA repair protein RAD51 homolog 4 [Cimex lectularius]